MPQDKNRTIQKVKITGKTYCRSTYGVEFDRKEKLTGITAKKYRTAKKRGKTKILDTFIEQTKYGRKYAKHILANEGKVKFVGKKLKVKTAHTTKRKRIYPGIYGKDVLKALEPIWRAFNYQCGKLLAPFLHANIDSIASDLRFKCEDEVVKKLRKISAATIDRLLKTTKAKMKIQGTNDTKPVKGIQKKGCVIQG